LGQRGATTLLVVSSSAPISGTFYACYAYPHGMTVTTVHQISGMTNAQLISGDALLLARSAKTLAIKLPPGYSLSGSEDVELSRWLSSAAGVPISGIPQRSFWHALFNFPSFLEGTFTNIATGQKFSLWNGDVITVTDSNGWTAQFQWQPLSTVQWALVPNSIRDAKGNPPGIAHPIAPPTAALPGATVTIPLPDGPTVIITPYDPGYPPGNLLGGIITVGDPINDPVPMPVFECPDGC
jgi:hypothetical protein